MQGTRFMSHFHSPQKQLTSCWRKRRYCQLMQPALQQITRLWHATSATYNENSYWQRISKQDFPLVICHRSKQCPKTYLISYFSIMLLYLSASILATMIGGTPSASWGAALSNCSKNPKKRSSEIGRDETEHLELGKIPQQLQLINLEIKNWPTIES